MNITVEKNINAMKEPKSKKIDNVKLFASAYLAAVARNLEYIEQIKKYEIQFKQLENLNISIKPVKGKYLIQIKMYLDQKEKVFDFTEIIQFIQFNGIETLCKNIRQIHHDFAVMNIREMTSQLNRHTPTINDYSEDIPNELDLLKTIADCIENIKEVQK